MEFKKGFSYEAKLIIEVESVERCIGKVSKTVASGNIDAHYVVHFLGRRMQEEFSTEKAAKWPLLSCYLSRGTQHFFCILSEKSTDLIIGL